jgi:hypothetical protein
MRAGVAWIVVAANVDYARASPAAGSSGSQTRRRFLTADEYIMRYRRQKARDLRSASASWRGMAHEFVR